MSDLVSERILDDWVIQDAEGNEMQRGTQLVVYRVYADGTHTIQTTTGENVIPPYRIE